LRVVTLLALLALVTVTVALLLTVIILSRHDGYALSRETRRSVSSVKGLGYEQSGEKSRGTGPFITSIARRRRLVGPLLRLCTAIIHRNRVLLKWK
jgi:hypothetical protein